MKITVNGVEYVPAVKTEPEKHSREWARTLPPETKLWHSSFSDPAAFMSAKNVTVGACRHTVDLFYIFGTSDWANALPEGTKVRAKVWNRGEYCTKTTTGWDISRHSLLPPAAVAAYNGGWELHTDPSPFWSSPDEVPVEAANGWIRTKGDSFGSRISKLEGSGMTSYCASWRWYEVQNLEWSESHKGPWRECRCEGGEK